jgi:hypothetical protein
MPKIAQASDAPTVNQDEIKIQESFGEKLRKYFKPHDTVKVQNVDDAPIEWRYLREDQESYTIEDDSNIKITVREEPELWRIEAGDLDVLDGGCAYLMIEALFKQVTAKKVGPVEHPLDQRDIRNFAFDDPEAQERFIKRVYLGKLTPQMMKEAALQSLGDTIGQTKQETVKSSGKTLADAKTA